MTKNDLYARLIQLGVSRGFEVIPEFVLPIPGTRRRPKIDLVWAVRKPGMPAVQDRPNLDYWTVVATFEIEGCDVRYGPEGKHFSRHIDFLPLARNREPDVPINHFVVLYTDAHDRNWKGNLPTRELIAERRGWAKGRPVRVVDGRKLAPIERFAALARRGIIRCNPFSFSDA